MSFAQHYEEPPPSPSGDRHKGLARLVRTITLVIGLGLIAWAVDSAFWSNRVQQAIADGATTHRRF